MLRAVSGTWLLLLMQVTPLQKIRQCGILVRKVTTCPEARRATSLPVVTGLQLIATQDFLPKQVLNLILFRLHVILSSPNILCNRQGLGPLLRWLRDPISINTWIDYTRLMMESICITLTHIGTGVLNAPTPVSASKHDFWPFVMLELEYQTNMRK